jgi:hypothetical protein
MRGDQEGLPRRQGGHGISHFQLACLSQMQRAAADGRL